MINVCTTLVESIPGFRENGRTMIVIPAQNDDGSRFIVNEAASSRLHYVNIAFGRIT